MNCQKILKFIFLKELSPEYISKFTFYFFSWFFLLLEFFFFFLVRFVANPLSLLLNLFIFGGVDFLFNNVCVLIAQSCPILCNPMDCSPPDSSVHEISQARVLKWIAFPFSRGSSPLRDETRISHIASRFFTVWATREAPYLKIKNI